MGKVRTLNCLSDMNYGNTSLFCIFNQNLASSSLHFFFMHVWKRRPLMSNPKLIGGNRSLSISINGHWCSACCSNAGLSDFCAAGVHMPLSPYTVGLPLWDPSTPWTVPVPHAPLPPVLQAAQSHVNLCSLSHRLHWWFMDPEGLSCCPAVGELASSWTVLL